MTSPWEFERIGEHHWRVYLCDSNVPSVTLGTEKETLAISVIPVLCEQIVKNENPSRDKVEAAVETWRAHNFPFIPPIRPLEVWLKDRPTNAVDKVLDRDARGLVISRIGANQRDRHRR